MTTHADSGLTARMPPRVLAEPDRRADQAAAARGERVPTLICCDGAYLQHSAVCLVSLLANNPELFFDIVIVSRPGAQLATDKLHRTLAQFPNHSLTLRAFSPPAELLLPLNPRAHYTLDSWNRLWVQEFFADDVDRVLYLDGDVVVVGSIVELWRTDLEENLVGAVDIPGAEVGVLRLGLRAEDGYFNSGVLLINLKRWREAQVLDSFTKFIVAHPELLVFTVDQEALNACLYDRKKRLDPKWNTVWTFFHQTEPVPLSQAEIAAVRRQACIIHFNNQPKPWSYFCVHPRKAEYDKYLRMTEWRDFVPPDRTLKNRLFKLAAGVLPAPAKRFARVLQYRLRSAASAR